MAKTMTEQWTAVNIEDLNIAAEKLNLTPQQKNHLIENIEDLSYSVSHAIMNEYWQDVFVNEIDLALREADLR